MASQPPDMPHVANLPDSATAHFRKDGADPIRSRSDLQQRMAEKFLDGSEIANDPEPHRLKAPAPSVSLQTEVNKATPIEGKLPGTDNPKPVVLSGHSSNVSSRNGALIDSIWIHTAGSLNIQSVASWYQDPTSQASVHYVVAWSGQTYQLVPDDSAAWHAQKENKNSIGIDVCAIQSQIMTVFQGTALKYLVVWLMREYQIPPENVKTDAEFMFAAVSDSFSEWVDGVAKAANPLPEVDTAISLPSETQMLG